MLFLNKILLLYLRYIFVISTYLKIYRSLFRYRKKKNKKLYTYLYRSMKNMFVIKHGINLNKVIITLFVNFTSDE